MAPRLGVECLSNIAYQELVEVNDPLSYLRQGDSYSVSTFSTFSGVSITSAHQGDAESFSLAIGASFIGATNEGAMRYGGHPRSNARASLILEKTTLLIFFSTAAMTWLIPFAPHRFTHMKTFLPKNVFRSLLPFSSGMRTSRSSPWSLSALSKIHGSFILCVMKK